MKKIIAILLALAVVSMAFAQTVSISNTLMTQPEITVDGGNLYWGFANDYFLRDEVVGEAVTADGRAKVKGRIRFDIQTLDPNETSILNVKPRWSWNSASNANDGNRSSVAAVLKPFDWLEVGIGNLDEVGYAFCCPGNLCWGTWAEEWKWGFNTVVGLAGKWQNVHELVHDGIQVLYTGVDGLKVGIGFESANTDVENTWSYKNKRTMLKKGMFNGLALGATYDADLFSVGANYKGNFGTTEGYLAEQNDKAYQDHTIYAGFQFKGLQEAKIGTTLTAEVGYYTAKASKNVYWSYYDYSAKAKVENKNNVPVSSFLFGIGAGFNFRNGITDDVSVAVGYNKIGGTSSKVLPFTVRNKIAYSISSDANFSFMLAYSQSGLAEKTSVAGNTNTTGALWTNEASTIGGATIVPTIDNGYGWLIGAKPNFSFNMGAHSFSMGVQTVVQGDIVPHAKTGTEWAWTGLRGRKAIVDFPISWKYTF